MGMHTSVYYACVTTQQYGCGVITYVCVCRVGNSGQLEVGRAEHLITKLGEQRGHNSKTATSEFPLYYST